LRADTQWFVGAPNPPVAVTRSAGCNTDLPIFLRLAPGLPAVARIRGLGCQPECASEGRAWNNAAAVHQPKNRGRVSVVSLSIVLHGISVTPLMSRYQAFNERRVKS